MANKIICGDALEVLRELPDQSVNCCVTSPPYWGLRDYGVEGQLGLEATPEEYVAKLVEVFREVRRVLRDDGTLWLNLGDTYNGYMANQRATSISANNQHARPSFERGYGLRCNLKPKDLVGIPWRVAFALQADGWWLRSDIIWCLSGGTYVYVRTQKGDMAMTIKDIARLDPATVQLWNGERWTQLLGMSKRPRRGDELTLVLRSGERISCTPAHKFPTNRGPLEAKDIVPGDVLQHCRLPEPSEPKRPTYLTEDAAWFAGLYIAEGSRSGDCIQISGHAKEELRWGKLYQIAAAYGGYATRTVDGNKMNVRLYGKVLNAIIDEFVSGHTAKDKHFSPVVWRYSNKFLKAMVRGYLDGDGHYDSKNERWRLGFTRNYNLERDLRTACARLGYKLTLNLSSVEYDGKRVPTFRGEIRILRSGHWNEKDAGEVVAIKKARCREVWDIGVADKSHLFALASGVLTHNSKPDPMPESVHDRPTKAHEYIFLLAKSRRYYYDQDAIREPHKDISLMRWGKGGEDTNNTKYNKTRPNTAVGNLRNSSNPLNPKGRNKRTVWTVATKPFKGAHFAIFPPDLIRPCILAGCPTGGIVLDPFFGTGTTGVVAKQEGRHYIGIELNPEYAKMAEERIARECPMDRLI